MTERPAFTIWRAAVSPASPAPTTMTSAERVAAWPDFGSAATAAPAAAAPIRPRRVIPFVAISPPSRPLLPRHCRGGALTQLLPSAAGARIANARQFHQLTTSCPAPSNAPVRALSEHGVAEQEEAALDDPGGGEASRGSRGVPRHARARAARPSRRHPDRAAGDRSRWPVVRGGRPPARHHRPPGGPSGAPGRRPARRLARALRPDRARPAPRRPERDRPPVAPRPARRYPDAGARRLARGPGRAGRGVG